MTDYTQALADYFTRPDEERRKLAEPFAAKLLTDPAFQALPHEEQVETLTRIATFPPPPAGPSWVERARALFGPVVEPFAKIEAARQRGVREGVETFTTPPPEGESPWMTALRRFGGAVNVGTLGAIPAIEQMAANPFEAAGMPRAEQAARTIAGFVGPMMIPGGGVVPKLAQKWAQRVPPVVNVPAASAEELAAASAAKRAAQDRARIEALVRRPSDVTATLEAAQQTRGPATPPPTGLPPPYATGTAPRPGRPVFTPLELGGPQLTAEKGMEHATGRELDLGEVGRRRAAQRYAAEAPPLRVADLVKRDQPPPTMTLADVNAVDDAFAQRLAAFDAPEPALAAADPATAAMLQRGKAYAKAKAHQEYADWLETKAKWRFLLPETTAQGHPASEGLITGLQRGRHEANGVTTYYKNQLRDAERLAGREQFPAVLKMLGTPGGRELAPQVFDPPTLQAYQQARRMMDDVYAAFPPEVQAKAPFVENYFPIPRQHGYFSTRNPDGLIVQTRSEAGWVPDELYVNPRIRPYFLQPRSLDKLPPDVSKAVLDHYLELAGKAIRFNGGTNPWTGQRFTPLVDELQPLIDDINRTAGPARRAWAAGEINTTLGRAEDARRWISPQFAQNFGVLQSVRTLGANVPAAALNATQSLNALRYVRADDWFAAWGMLRDPKFRTLAQRYGITAELGPTGEFLQVLNELPKTGGLMDALRAANKIGMYGFRVTEQLTRNHAFAAGLRLAAREGLTSEAAAHRALQLVDDTIFNFERAARPAMFRSPAGSLAWMFKQYATHQARFFSRMLVDTSSEVATALSHGDVARAVAAARGPAQFFAATVLLGGEDAIPFGKQLREVGSDTRWRGILPYVGVALTEQFGLGSTSLLPSQGLRDWVSDMAFFLPGPAASMVVDGAAIVATLARDVAAGDDPRDYSWNAITRGKFGQPMNPDQFAAAITRVFPGVAANRIRDAAVGMRAAAVGHARIPEATTLGEAFAVGGAPSGRAARAEETTPTALLRRGLGFETPRHEAERRVRSENFEDDDRWKAAMSQANRLMDGGRRDEAIAVIKRVAPKIGASEAAALAAANRSRQAHKRAVRPGASPLERQTRQAPRILRKRFRDRLRELEAEEAP